MKTILLALSLACVPPLASCGGVSDDLGAMIGIGAVVGSVSTIQRTPADALYSWWTGRDCSVVRLDQGKTYCRPIEPPPEPPPYCTRGLATVDCWKDPDTVPNHPRGVADGPTTLTPAQEADRVRTWP
jgi:hypothetical protein